MTTMNSEQIKELLPHRYPFLLIDRIESIEEGKSLHAIKNVTVNEPFFNGHFPQLAVMPGVLIVEAMAQASGILAHVSYPNEYGKGSLSLLAGIDKARFKRMVVPGDRLDIEVVFLKSRQGVGKFECTARVDGEVACVAELMSAQKKG